MSEGLRKALLVRLPVGSSYIARDREHPERISIVWDADQDIEMTLTTLEVDDPAAAPGDADPLKDFLEACCEERRNLFATVCDLMTAYGWWAEQNEDHFPLRREEFSEQLQAKGFRQNRSRRADGKQCRTWEGLALRPWALRIARQRKAEA